MNADTFVAADGKQARTLSPPPLIPKKPGTSQAPRTVLILSGLLGYRLLSNSLMVQTDMPVGPTRVQLATCMGVFSSSTGSKRCLHLSRNLKSDPLRDLSHFLHRYRDKYGNLTRHFAWALRQTGPNHQRTHYATAKRQPFDHSDN